MAGFNYQQANQNVQNLSNLREAIAKQRPTDYGAGALNLLAQVIAARGQNKNRDRAQQAQQGFTQGVMQDITPQPAQPIQNQATAQIEGGDAITSNPADMTRAAQPGMSLAQSMIGRGNEFGMPEQTNAGFQALLANQAAQQTAANKPNNPFGTGFEGLAWKTVLDESVDPQSPQGQAAYAIISTERTVTDPQTGQPVTIKTPIPDVIAKRFGTSDQPQERITPKFSDAENKAMFFSDRMIDAQNVYDELLTEGYEPGSWSSAWFKGVDDMTPEVLGGLVVPENDKRYLASALNFVTGVLRPESGAAISVDEFEKEYKKYYPQFGDGPKTVADKDRLRDIAMNSQKFAARMPLEERERLKAEGQDFGGSQSGDSEIDQAAQAARDAGATEKEIKAITGK